MTGSSPEQHPLPSLELDDYQRFVASTRRPDTYEGLWQNAYSKYIASEQLEFLIQHGVGALLLLPRSYEYPEPESGDELRYNLADEAGDLLWFGFDIADRLEFSAADLCTNGLRSYTSSISPAITSFAELEENIMRSAQKVKVINKIGLLFADANPDHADTALADNPNYVFMRAGQRLRRSLDQGERDLAPPSATELEPIQPVAESVALFILTLAYIAKDRLGVSIEDIARFNMAKLAHRQQFGKANDIKFSPAFIR